MKLNPEILILGAINMDLVIKASRMPKIGESRFGEDFKMVPGGKASNYAVTISNLGGRAKLIARVGNDFFGQTLVDNLVKIGVDTTHIAKDSKETTGTALIVINKEGDNSILVAGGANMNWSKKDIDLIEDIFQEFDFLLISLEIPMKIVGHALSIAQKYNLKVILDPGPTQRCPPSLLSRVNILSPNETEAEVLTGKKIDDLNSAWEASGKLLKTGIEVVIMKLGAKGALLVDKKGKKYFPSIKVPVVDTTAAGDAFIGALTYCYAKGIDLESAVKYANYVGALTVTKFGAQPSIPEKNEIEEFIKRNDFESSHSSLKKK